MQESCDYLHTIISKNQHSPFYVGHKTPYLPPRTLHDHCIQFLPGITILSEKKLKTMLVPIFFFFGGGGGGGVVNKVLYGQ